MGYFLAFGSALLWGVSGTSSQYLFSLKGIDAAWLVATRLILAGVGLLGFSLLKPKERKDFFAIWKNKKDRMGLLIFGIFGMLAVQFTFFITIQYSNAATATVLQYLGPALIVFYYALQEMRLPKSFESFALILAVLGTFLLVTHGDWNKLHITPAALILGLLSAVALAFYSIQPIPLAKKYNSSLLVGWAMLVGGLTLSVVRQPWDVPGTWDSGTFLAFSFVIVFGTLLPFQAYVTSVRMIGAKTASLLSCAEPLSAAIIAVLWLKVSFGVAEWLGTISILVAILILTIKGKASSH